jgi:hypothetical protein
MMNSVKRLRSEHLSKLAWIPLLARSTALARNTLTPRPVKEGHAAMLLVWRSRPAQHTGRTKHANTVRSTHFFWCRSPSCLE